MNLREKCRAAMRAEVAPHEAGASYHMLTAHSDGAVSWRTTTTLFDRGVAEHYGWRRDYWSLQQFGGPRAEFNLSSALCELVDDIDDIDELLREAIETLDAIPEGFFCDEPAGAEWCRMLA